MACRPPVGDGPKGPSTKSAHPLRDEWALRKGRSSYVLWTDEMIGRMQAHPERTAAEIAAELRVTPSAVRHARQRYGRFSTGTDGLCIVCDARPVFDTSAQAKKWRSGRDGSRKRRRATAYVRPRTDVRSRTEALERLAEAIGIKPTKVE